MKRKRVDDPAGVSEGVSAKQQRVRYKLKGGVAKLRKSFKIAKGFERQKLGRRSKDAAAGKGDRDAQKVQAEIAALKSLDIDASAEHHLHKTLMKDKAVAQHPDLPPEIKELGKLPPDGPTLNVNARLCNSNPVQVALKDAVEDVKRALGVEDDGSNSLKKKRVRAKDFATNGDAADRSKGERKTSTERERDSRRAENAFSEEVSDYDEYAARLASVSVNDDDNDDDDDVPNVDLTNVAALERQLAQEGIRTHSPPSKRQPYNHHTDLSLSASSSPSRSASPEPQKSTRTTKTTFIPSLTMGGYISGSGGSDIEDVDVAPKRNRRGQRARQQIWEQKYGGKAKHLQNPKQGRDAGWDRKRGAVEERGRGGGRSGRGRADDAVGEMRSKRARTDDGSKKKDEGQDRPMHPSWEAAKRAKEKREAPVAFKGVKTTFD